MIEEFKDIPGYEGFYQISNFGKVKSFNSQDKEIRFLSPHKDKYGYYRAILSVSGIRKGLTVHRMVANSFIPPVEGKTHVNHKNGIKADNTYTNLEWCTNHENRLHAISTGLQSMAGERNNFAKLSEGNVVNIRHRSLLGESPYALAREFNVNYSCINKIVKRKTWKHVE